MICTRSAPDVDDVNPTVTPMILINLQYGFCPKGSSVVMYRHESFLHHQYFAYVDWPGGIYATPTSAGASSVTSVA